MKTTLLPDVTGYEVLWKTNNKKKDLVKIEHVLDPLQIVYRAGCGVEDATATFLTS